ncbi:MAG: hypothetical protein JNM51_03630 [Bacteroidia bacterium]|nr:hypothetical protein [Bacteroidia bacterium]
MKALFFFSILIFSCSLMAQSKKMKLKLVQYIPYCGGVTSKSDLKNTPNKSKVYANKKLVVVSDNHVIDTLITDKSGYLKANFENGIYYLFEPWKYYQKIPAGFTEINLDMDCLKEQWKKEDLKIVVSKKTTTVANNIKLLECPDQFPCMIHK